MGSRYQSARETLTAGAESGVSQARVPIPHLPQSLLDHVRSFPCVSLASHVLKLRSGRRSTGLYPASHGIVANDFWDPATGKEFVYIDPTKSWSGEWWGGEPVRANPSPRALAACPTLS